MEHGHDAASDEPQTPMWLPALGVALFLAAGIWWATQPSPPPPAPEPAASASASAAPAASAPPAASAAQAAPPPMPVRLPPRHP